MPGKSWALYSDGTAIDADEAQVEAMSSVLDHNNQLRKDLFPLGVNVEMFECQAIEDFKITPANVATFRKNYLGIHE